MYESSNNIWVHKLLIHNKNFKWKKGTINNIFVNIDISVIIQSLAILEKSSRWLITC